MMRLMKYTSNLITALIISVIVNSSLASILSNSTIDQVNNLFDMPESYSFVSPAFKKLSTPEKKKLSQFWLLMVVACMAFFL